MPTPPEMRGLRPPRSSARARRDAQATHANGAGAIESIEIHTSDGRALRADVREPPKNELVGVAVLSHAMMARRTEFERPASDGLARFFVSRGWRTIAFDFRGHGDSGPGAATGASWTYDDLVQRDMPAVVACARARARSRANSTGKKLPVIIVGHSLGGHVALAAQGIGLLDVDAIVGVGANVWVHAFEPNMLRWAVKRAAMTAILAVCRRRGYFPARAIRMGSDDEPAAYFAAFERYTRTGEWKSDDGRHDYLASLANVTIPVLAIASDGDRLNCHPACAEAMLARTSGPRRFERIRRADDGGRAPGHMEIVTTNRARSAFARAMDWLETTLRA